MDGFTIVDGAVALAIVLSALLAYSRGLIREAMAIVGWVGAAVAAYAAAPLVAPLVEELPVVGDYLRDSCELSVIAAFAAMFAVALVVVSVFTPLLSSVVRRTRLSGLDQALGFLFGAARGILLVAVALVIYDRAIAPEGAQAGAGIRAVEESRTERIFDNVAANLDEQLPESAPGWIVQRYEALVSACAG